MSQELESNESNHTQSLNLSYEEIESWQGNTAQLGSGNTAQLSRAVLRSLVRAILRSLVREILPSAVVRCITMLIWQRLRILSIF